MIRFPTTFAEPWCNWVQLVTAIVAVVLAVATVTGMILHNPPAAADGEKPPKPRWALLAMVFWALVPPAYFWYEFNVMWKTGAPTVSLEVFKYSQELSRNIWLAFVALLAGLYFR